MKKYFSIITVVLSVIISGILTPAYGQWSKYVIDDNTGTAVSVDAADMDGDTKPDLIVTCNSLNYYKNNFPDWEKSIIADEGVITFAYAGDMDGDDTLDIVANIYSKGKLVWYENNHPIWTQHIIDNGTYPADFIQVVDIDGNDTLDVVATMTPGYYNNIGDIVWYKNNHPKWTKHIIDSGLYGAPVINITDLDGDGFRDVVATLDLENDVVWYKTGDEGLTWTKNIVDSNLTYAMGVDVRDIDRDGDMDIAAASGGPYYDAQDVVWYENDNLKWTRHSIDNNLPGGVVPYITDVDGNESMDVITTGFENGEVVWYENNHPMWVKDTIDAFMPGARVFDAADIDGDEISDVIVPGGSSVAWYKNPYTTVAFGQSLELYPTYIRSDGDTLIINAYISNPENHPATVIAILKGDENSFQDSVELFDDGLHRDGQASDNIYGSVIWSTDLVEDMYIVKVYTNDLTTGNTDLLPLVSHFTTAGPVEVESHEILQIADENRLRVANITLTNNGSEKPITDIRVDIFSNDTSVTDIAGSKSLSELAPGETKTAGGIIAIYVNEIKEYKFIAEISSNDVVYWTDTIYFDPTVGVNDELELPEEFALDQNYPNPFNPSTTIKYSLPVISWQSSVGSQKQKISQSTNHPIYPGEVKRSRINQSNGGLVSLKIYDVLGKEVATLVNQQQRPGSYEVKWDASGLTSGVYFYKLSAGEFMSTRKLLLLK